MLDTICLELLDNAPVQQEPYPYVIVPNFVRYKALPAIQRDYPKTYGPGSFPVRFLEYGPSFQALLNDLKSEQFRHCMERLFDMNLQGYPAMVTARGEAHKLDGQIHTDSTNKILTVLIYMNTQWDTPGGCLRLLRSSFDLEDYAAEIAPMAGTMVAFKVTPNGWHGHKSIKGPRKVIQFNYVTNTGTLLWEEGRHGASALFKRCQHWCTSWIDRLLTPTQSQSVKEQDNQVNCI